MGFSSQSGYLGLRQYAGGTVAPADLGSAGVVYRLKSGSLGMSRDLLIPDAEIGGNRDISDAYLGAASWAGDLDMYLRLKEAGSLLFGVLGIDTPGGGPAPAPITHTITPTEGNLPFFYVEEQISNTFERFQYSDAVMNTFHLEADANGYLSATVGMIAKRQIIADTATAGLVDNVDVSPMVVGTNITLTMNGVTLPAKSFSLDINNNVEDDDHRLGTFFLGDLTAKRREVTAGFTIRPQDSALWRQAAYGTPTATAIGGLTTKSPLVITMSTYEDIPGATGEKYSLAITLPNTILQPFDLSPSGDDIIEHDVTVQAVRPDNANPIMTAVLTTDKDTLA